MSRTMLLVCPAALVACFAAGTSAITIQFDYSLDGPFPFFDTAEKKAVLEAAADVYEELIGDRLLAIEPSGDNWWRVHIPNPGTGGLSMQFDMSIPEDTVRIFVGGRDIRDDDLASVDVGKVYGDGSGLWESTVLERGQENARGIEASDVGSWGGAMSFDTTTPFGYPRNWLFGLDSEPGPDEHDFFSAVLHEIPKVLGIGTADSWDAQVDWDDFTFNGPEAVAQFGGPVPLDSSAPDNPTHWAVGTQSISLASGDTRIALNTRVLPVGTREELTELDVAALADLGWEIQWAGWNVLQPGDADQDGDFDRLDLVQVLQAARYLTGQPATWGDGDWNGGPGGYPGEPPAGDGLFDEQDIVAALQTGKYLSGPYAAGGNEVDAVAAVPEPTSVALLVFGLLALTVTRLIRRNELPIDHMKIPVASITAVVIVAAWARAGVLVPEGLQAGDTYHLFFVTEGTRDGTSSDIEHYNAFVQTEAEREGATTQNFGIEWYAIASTATVDARDNAPMEAPIYMLDEPWHGGDAFIGEPGEYFPCCPWPLNVTQFGVGIDDNEIAITGTSDTGHKAPGHALGDAEVAFTDLYACELGPCLWFVGIFTRPAEVPGHMFALSEKLTVPAPPPALQAGDANQDGVFNQYDIVQVLQAAKYLTGQARRGARATGMVPRVGVRAIRLRAMGALIKSISSRPWLSLVTVRRGASGFVLHTAQSERRQRRCSLFRSQQALRWLYLA